MIVVSFDLLAMPGESLALRKPCPDARKLWDMLFQAHHGQIILLSVDNPSMDVLSHWLKTEGYKPAVVDISRDSGPEAKHDRLQALQAGYGRIRFYYDTEPRAVAYALREGIPSLLFANPSVPRPEWSVDKVVRSWDSVVEELEHQRLKQSEATWGDIE